MSSTCYWNLLLWPEVDICTGTWGLFDPVHAAHPLASNSAGTGRSGCCATKRGVRVRCPHPARRRREEERDGAMKMSDASESGRAVNMSGRGGVEGGGGGAGKEGEGQR